MIRRGEKAGRLLMAGCCCLVLFLILPAFGRGADTDHSQHVHAVQTDAHMHADTAPADRTDHDNQKDHSAHHPGADPPAGHDSGTQTDPHHDHSQMVMDGTDAGLASQVKVEEKLGEYIDLTARFLDANGHPVSIGAVFDKPVVLLPIWFFCPSVCTFLQADLAKALNQVPQKPGTDFNVITLSFSDDEDPSHALAAKHNYANLIQREFPLENWFYLTGDAQNIRQVTDSLGYYFIKKQPHMYIHPNVMVVLASDGKIIRYLYGPGFLPFDLGMALTEAQKGEPGVSIKRRVLSFCFDYDPENKTYVFRLFRITGTVILILLAGFMVFLLRPSKKKEKNRTDTRDP
jgi:protein SCO1